MPVKAEILYNDHIVADIPARGPYEVEIPVGFPLRDGKAVLYNWSCSPDDLHGKISIGLLPEYKENKEGYLLIPTDVSYFKVQDLYEGHPFYRSWQLTNWNIVTLHIEHKKARRRRVFIPQTIYPYYEARVLTPKKSKPHLLTAMQS